jgi:hypothetical protein
MQWCRCGREVALTERRLRDFLCRGGLPYVADCAFSSAQSCLAFPYVLSSWLPAHLLACWPASALPATFLSLSSSLLPRAALHGLLQGLVGLGEGVPTGWGWSQWWLPEPMAPKKTAKEQQQHEAPPPCTTKVALTVQDFVSAFQYPPFRWLFITNMCNAVCKCSSSMTMSQALARLQLIRTPSHRPSLPRSVLLAWAGRLSQQQTLASQAFSSSTGFRTRLVRMASAC